MQDELPLKWLKLKFTRAEKKYGAVLCGMQLNEAIDAVDHNLYLHNAELDYAQGELSTKRRREFIAGRIVSKLALQQLLPKYGYLQWQISRGVFTQPIVEGPGALGICITHTAEIVVAIAYPLAHQIGIDIESIPPEIATSIIFEHCSKSEIEQAILSMESESRAALKLWTCKESLSKILGTGLMTPFHFYELNDFKYSSPVHNSKFVHFPQYQSNSWFGKQHCLSISFPANSAFQCSDEAWEDWRSFFFNKISKPIFPFF